MAEQEKVKCAIIGSGNIGTDLIIKIKRRSKLLEIVALIGIDPVPYRLPYPFRLILLIGIMAMHAFFGISIMSQSGLMLADWFGSMGRTWGVPPLEDQYIGGGVAWSVGEIPTLILAIAVAIQWSRNDDRAQRRRDRHVDRVGDDELDAYNARLAALADQDARGDSTRGAKVTSPPATPRE